MNKVHGECPFTGPVQVPSCFCGRARLDERISLSCLYTVELEPGGD